MITLRISHIVLEYVINFISPKFQRQISMLSKSMRKHLNCDINPKITQYHATKKNKDNTENSTHCG